MKFLTKNLPFLFPDLSTRSTTPELMDDPATNPAHLHTTLKQFRYINIYLSKTRALIRSHIFAHAKQHNLSTISFVDLGSGACDTSLWFVQECKKQGFTPKVTCIDYDSRVIEFARTACAHIPEITIIQADMIANPDAIPAADYIFSNHLLHHLTDSEIRQLLTATAAKARQGILFSDLERNSIWYFGFTVLSSIFFRNSFTFYDGRVSISKGFTLKELKNYLTMSLLQRPNQSHKGALGHLYITTIPNSPS